MVAGCGPLPVLQTLRDKEPFSRRGGFLKERVIVSGPGVGTDLIESSGSDVPALRFLPLHFTAFGYASSWQSIRQAEK